MRALQEKSFMAPPRRENEPLLPPLNTNSDKDGSSSSSSSFTNSKTPNMRDSYAKKLGYVPLVFQVRDYILVPLLFSYMLCVIIRIHVRRTLGTSAWLNSSSRPVAWTRPRCVQFFFISISSFPEFLCRPMTTKIRRCFPIIRALFQRQGPFVAPFSIWLELPWVI